MAEGLAVKRNLRQQGVSYLVAILSVAGMVLLRWLMDPWLGNQLPFSTLFGAVAAAVWYGGYRPALVAAALGYLACDYLFIEPRGTAIVHYTQGYVGLVLYLLICSIIIGFGQGMRVARSRADKQRESLRVTFVSMGDGVITTDAEGRVASLNPVAVALTGWTEDEAAGRPLTEVFPILNEHTRQPVENPVRRVLDEGKVVGLANHTMLRAKDGTERPIDDSAAPIKDSQGDVVGVVLIFRDVTERKQGERSARFLASIVESSEDAIIGKDVNGIITSWNRAAERLFGYSAAEAIGRPITMLAPPDRADEMPAMLVRLKRGERFEHFDTVRRAKDGRLVPISLTVSPIKDKNGEIIGASKIARDISERKRAEQALSEADRRKDEFLATLAHELRNPLATIHNAIELLQRPDGSADSIQQASKMMERQVRQMVRLVNDLLDISRITQGKVQLRKERVKLAAVVQSAVEASRPAINAPGHELTVTLPSEPIYLDADPTRLAQVFANLLDNAAKYSEKEGHIWLTAERQGGEVVVSVRDTGIGIAAEHLPGIFEMFSQVQPARERSQGGLGIGLALVRRLVESHGGTIEAHSAGVAMGSKFIVRLPIADIQAGPRQDSRGPEKRDVRTVRPCRILVVDDNRDAADSLMMMLRMMGHETVTAYDGLEAVQTAATFRPEVVLLDIGLPGMSGYDAAQRIRQQSWGNGMVLIALTGWGQEEDKRRAQEAGFDHHLTKPVEAVSLEKLLALNGHIAQS